MSEVNWTETHYEAFRLNGLKEAIAFSQEDGIVTPAQHLNVEICWQVIRQIITGWNKMGLPWPDGAFLVQGVTVAQGALISYIARGQTVPYQHVYIGLTLTRRVQSIPGTGVLPRHDFSTGIPTLERRPPTLGPE